MRRTGWFRVPSYNPNLCESSLPQGTDPDDQTPSSQGEPFGESSVGSNLAARDPGVSPARRTELLPPGDLSPGTAIPPLPSPGNKRRGTFR